MKWLRTLLGGASVVATADLARQAQRTEQAVATLVRVAQADAEVSAQVAVVASEWESLRSSLSRWIKAVGGGA